MAEGQLGAEWAQTSEVLALTYNINRPPKRPAIPSWKFNPFGKPPARKTVSQADSDEAWSMFRGLFDRGVFGGQRR